jgi:hypothetical protein
VTNATATTAPSSFAVHALQELSLARNLGQFTEAVERLALSQTEGGIARYFRYDADEQKLTRPGPTAEGDLVLPVAEESLAGWCALHGETIVVGDANSKKTAFGASGEPNKAGAFPMHQYGALVGVLLVNGGARDLAGPVLTALEELAQVAGTVEQFVTRREDWQNFTNRTQEMFVRAIEFFGTDGEGHTMRVAQLCSLLGNLLDLSARAKQNLWSAALYHDIGILAMVGQDETQIERFHPQAGADFMASASAFRQAGALVAVSHERFDGSGFPNGLKGDQVPLEGWCLAVAEEFDGVYSEDPEQSFENWVNRFFDDHAPSHHPEVIDALTQLIDGGKVEPLYS